MTNKKNESMPEDYIKVVYGHHKPYTSYPEILTKYLINRFEIIKDSKLLDLGCGRGEFLSGFSNEGLDCYGVDFTNSALINCPNASIKQADIENDGLPYPDNYFDVIFSKSVIEHFHNPDFLVKEIFRSLKPGGLAIIMVPSWEYNYKIYFEDHTHRSPFMRPALKDILMMHGFLKIKVDFFKQLPILWGKYYLLLNPLSFITRILTPRFLGRYFKWVRFSKEIMLLSSSFKPKESSS
jgi:SAM-dependent methyltransferase